ncbi:MAG: hypothetical protein Q9187_004863, partial [Circinaria calcarea]
PGRAATTTVHHWSRQTPKVWISGISSASERLYLHSSFSSPTPNIRVPRRAFTQLSPDPNGVLRSPSRRAGKGRRGGTCYGLVIAGKDAREEDCNHRPASPSRLSIMDEAASWWAQSDTEAQFRSWLRKWIGSIRVCVLGMGNTSFDNHVVSGVGMAEAWSRKRLRE